jgi:hypothetical protein
MFLLTARQVKTAAAAAAGAGVYLAASELAASRRVRLTGLFMLTTAAMAGVMTAGASQKARAVDNRLSNFLNNGGYIGGNLKVAAEVNTTTFKINGTPLTLNHGSPTAPGGGPLSYSPSYESSQSSCMSDIIIGLKNANIFA